MRTPLIAILLAALLTAGCSRPVAELRLLQPQQPLNRAIAEDVVAFLDEASSIRIRLVEAPDDLTTLDALEAGIGDLAFASNDQPYRRGVTTVMPLYPTVLHIVMREERLAESLTDMLDGARVYAGPRGSASRLLHERFVASLDLAPESQVYLDSPRGTDPDIVVVYTAISPDQVPELPGYRLASFGTPDDIGKGSSLDRMTLFNPRMRPFIIPVGTYGSATPDPVVTVAVDQLLVARNDIEGPVVYDLIQEIQRIWPALSSNYPSVFRTAEPTIDDSALAFPLARGARFFFNRDEPTFIERYSGVAEVLVTLLIALVSGSFAAVNIYRIRRKNRIDRFYTEVFMLLKIADKPFDIDERNAAIGKVHELQKRAFDMLVDEKLAADDSFRIFMSLANDTISELGDPERPGPFPQQPDLPAQSPPT